MEKIYQIERPVPIISLSGDNEFLDPDSDVVDKTPKYQKGDFLLPLCKHNIGRKLFSRTFVRAEDLVLCISSFSLIFFGNLLLYSAGLPILSFGAILGFSGLLLFLNLEIDRRREFQFKQGIFLCGQVYRQCAYHIQWDELYDTVKTEFEKTQRISGKMYLAPDLQKIWLPDFWAEKYLLKESEEELTITKQRKTR